jgi:hypothetical protein
MQLASSVTMQVDAAVIALVKEAIIHAQPANMLAGCASLYS